MHTRNDRKHPALKHGAYSAIAVLPGENRAEFEKLRRDLIEPSLLHPERPRMLS